MILLKKLTEKHAENIAKQTTTVLTLLIGETPVEDDFKNKETYEEMVDVCCDCNVDAVLSELENLRLVLQNTKKIMRSC